MRILAILLFCFAAVVVDISTADAQCWIYTNIPTNDWSCADQEADSNWQSQYCHGCTSTDGNHIPIVDRNWTCNNTTYQSLADSDPVQWNLKVKRYASWFATEGYVYKTDWWRRCGVCESCDSDCAVTEYPTHIDISCYAIHGGYLEYEYVLLDTHCEYHRQ